VLDRLAAAIGRHCVGLGSDTAVPRLFLAAVEEPIEPIDVLYEPMICFVASGVKRTTAGELKKVAQPGEMHLTTIDLPVTIELEHVPYRAAVMQPDDQAITELLVELDESGQTAPLTAGGQLHAPMTPELVDAVTRWVQLLDTPEDICPLAPGSRARSSTGCCAAPSAPSCASGRWQARLRPGCAKWPDGYARTTPSRSASTRSPPRHT
jgi:hypothetical protein